MLSPLAASPAQCSAAKTPKMPTPRQQESEAGSWRPTPPTSKARRLGACISALLLCALASLGSSLHSAPAAPAVGSLLPRSLHSQPSSSSSSSSSAWAVEGSGPVCGQQQHSLAAASWPGLPTEQGLPLPAAPALTDPAAYHATRHHYTPPLLPAPRQAALAALAALGCQRGNSDSPTLARVFQPALAPSPLAARTPLPLAAALLRSDSSAASRHAFAEACIQQHPSYALPEAYASRVHHGREMGPEEPYLSDRTLLAAHGGTLHARLAAFAAQHSLHTPADWRFTSGFSGPWVEDVFRATFFKRMAHRISLASAQARLALLAQAAAPDEGAGYLLFVCSPQAGFAAQGPDSLEAYFAGVEAGACSKCALSAQGVAAAARPEELQHWGGGGCSSGSGSDSGSNSTPPLIYQLFLSLPYDSELFYPLVPIPPYWENLMFVYSTAAALTTPGLLQPDAWQHDMARLRPSLLSTPPSLIQLFQQLLLENTRKDVHYLTVAQRPDGPWLASNYERATASIAALAHTVVINSGGNGHVPIPLLHAEFPLLPVEGLEGSGGGAEEEEEAAEDPQQQRPPPAARAAVPPGTQVRSGFFQAPEAAAASLSSYPPPPLTFYGTLREGLRAEVDALLRARVPGYSSAMLPITPDNAWVAAFVNSTLALCPRGVGATSFRLYEALQLGVPAVFVYDGRPWLPYLHPQAAGGLGVRSSPPEPYHSPLQGALPGAPAQGAAFPWGAVLHAVELGGLAQWVEGVLPGLLGGEAGRAAWVSMRQQVEGVRASHFTYPGVMQHIWRFVADPWAAELHCSPAKRPLVSLY